MTGERSNPFDAADFTRDIVLAQEKFLSGALAFERLGDMAHLITQAQIAYGRAILSANAAMFGGWMTPAQAREPAVLADRGITLTDDPRAGARTG